ncbi:4'-phosphopantetheinyl transferase family protein [Puniceibacterium sediminis]|uniref:Enterobactin synthase component D n=1 Tax=Puniceibacterium sediminis TaxID=1608407 RepID=A0A238YVB5_9RHOB|nr:4'-phosphopantetheinyl transferase superfamily protein [Puniceibacterium sediminis]SNR75085.1 enterobactin synthetase component D [Puniceibacterium sediminis]
MTDADTSHLPHWLEQGGLCARWMALDGGDMSGLGIALPQVLERAVAKRQGEYRAGRTCARAAIDQVSPTSFALDKTDWPIFGPDRAPVWPTGIIGSLTHSPARVICVAGPADRYDGLGIDIEPAVPPRDSLTLAPRIFCPEELALVEPTSWAEAGFTLIFSAKEAIYKAVYPTIRRFADFHEVRLAEVSGDDLQFELMPEMSSDLGQQKTLQVRATWWQGHVLTFCARPGAA